jgi:hypothetical protein
MSPNQAAPSFPAHPLGRKRTRNFDLPPHMAMKGGSFYYVCNGKPRVWIPLGTDRAKALRLWAEHEAGPQVGLSVGDLVQRYIDSIRGTAAHSTIIQYNSYQRELARSFPIPAAQLRPEHVALWRELPGQRGRKTYVSGCIAVLRAACYLGHEQGLCQLIAVKGFGHTSRDRRVEDAEFVAIRDKAPDWLKVAMNLAYYTGARPCDIRALQWAQVGDTLKMRQKKTGTWQAFRITAEVEDTLAMARQRRILGLYVVANHRGKRITEKAMATAFQKARQDAKVDYCQFRDIRAKAATTAAEDGQDATALLGHADKRMTERYIRGRKVIYAEPVRKKL